MTDCPPWIVFLGPRYAVEPVVEARTVWIKAGQCAEPVGGVTLMRERFPSDAVLAVLPAPRPPKSRET